MERSCGSYAGRYGSCNWGFNNSRLFRGSSQTRSRYLYPVRKNRSSPIQARCQPLTRSQRRSGFVLRRHIDPILGRTSRSISRRRHPADCTRSRPGRTSSENPASRGDLRGSPEAVRARRGRVSFHPSQMPVGDVQAGRPPSISVS